MGLHPCSSWVGVSSPTQLRRTVLPCANRDVKQWPVSSSPAISVVLAAALPRQCATRARCRPDNRSPSTTRLSPTEKARSLGRAGVRSWSGLFSHDGWLSRRRAHRGCRVPSRRGIQPRLPRWAETAPPVCGSWPASSLGSPPTRTVNESAKSGSATGSRAARTLGRCAAAGGPASTAAARALALLTSLPERSPARGGSDRRQGAASRPRSNAVLQGTGRHAAVLLRDRDEHAAGDGCVS
jgi:hypothetical protein